MFLQTVCWREDSTNSFLEVYANSNSPFSKVSNSHQKHKKILHKNKTWTNMAAFNGTWVESGFEVNSRRRFLRFEKNLFLSFLRLDAILLDGIAKLYQLLWIYHFLTKFIKNFSDQRAYFSIPRIFFDIFFLELNEDMDKWMSPCMRKIFKIPHAALFWAKMWFLQPTIPRIPERFFIEYQHALRRNGCPFLLIKFWSW